MSRPKDIGTTAERGLVEFLRTHGWPTAERRALAGTADMGDVVGCAGLVFEMKSGRAAEVASDGQILAWLMETEAERLNAGADIGILVTKRTSYGPARAGAWWAHLALSTWDVLYEAPAPRPWDPALSLRLRLDTVVPLLHAAGYGTAPASAEAVGA